MSVASGTQIRTGRGTHVFGGDAPAGVVDEALAEQVEAIRARGGEEVAQGRLGELPDGHVVRQLRVALRTRASDLAQRKHGASRQKREAGAGGESGRTGQSSSVGVPSARKIVLSWSMSVSPGRYGVRSMSSAKMQPTDQTSTAVL